MKRNNERGFSLAELLIVVAIIAVLVAIAIPVFSNRLENARKAVDEANCRSAYGEAAAECLAGGTEGADSGTVLVADLTYTWKLNAEGKIEVEANLSTLANTGKSFQSKGYNLIGRIIYAGS